MPSFTWGRIEEKTPLPILIRKLNTKLRGLVRDTEMSVEFTISPAPASTGDVLRFNGTTWQNYPTILYSNLPSAASRVWALGGDASFTGGSLTVADFIAASLTADSLLVAGTFLTSRVGGQNQVTGGDGITTQGLNTVFTANAGTNAGANDNDAAFAWSVGGVEQWRAGVLGDLTGLFPSWVLWDSVNDAAVIQVDQGTSAVGFGGDVQIAGDVDMGIVNSGTWQGNPVAEAYGGTDQSTYAKGDMLIASAVDTLAKLAAPATDGWVLTFNDTTDLPEWRASGSGAPSDAEYIVGAASAGLSAERVGTDTAEIDWDFGTAGQAKLNVLAINASKIAAGTFPAGAFVFAGTVSGITTLTATTLAGTLSTATQNSVTTMTALTTIGTLVAGAVPASLVTAGTFGAGGYIFPSTLTATGVLTTVTDIAMSHATLNLIRTATADAADSSRLVFAGGGAASTSRGGVIAAYGNEFGSSLGGWITLNAGDFAGAAIALLINGTSIVNVTAGGVTLTQNLTTMDIIMSNATSIIRMTTVDGADTGRLSFVPGGALSTDRGALFSIFGNEFGSGVSGWAVIDAGNVAGSSIDLRIAGSSKLLVTSGGVTSTDLLTASASIVIGSPTGGNKGAGTLNAAASIYVNAIPLTTLATARAVASLRL